MADDICECPKCGRQHRDLGFGQPPKSIMEQIARDIRAGTFPKKSESIFAAWHPVEGFGPTNEISLRDHYDHAMTDVRLLSHTGDMRWRVVEVEMTVCQLRTPVIPTDVGTGSKT